MSEPIQSEPALFPCLSRMCIDHVEQLMWTQEGVLVGAFAVMQHLTPVQLLRFVGSNARAVNIELRVPEGSGSRMTQTLQNALVDSMIHAFKSPGSESGSTHSFVYMADHVLRNWTHRPDKYTLLHDNNEASASIFGVNKQYLSGKSGLKRYQLNLRARSLHNGKAAAFDMIDVVEVARDEFRVLYDAAVILRGWKVASNVSLQDDMKLLIQGHHSLLRRVSRDRLQILLHSTYDDNVSVEQEEHTRIPMGELALANLSMQQAGCLLQTKITGMSNTPGMSRSGKSGTSGTSGRHGKSATSLADIVYAYSVDSSRYNVACMVARYGRRDGLERCLTGSHCMQGLQYKTFTAALKRAALAAFCINKSSLPVPRPTEPMVKPQHGESSILSWRAVRVIPKGLAILHTPMTDNPVTVSRGKDNFLTDGTTRVLTDRKETRFTVYRAVDYFQPQGGTEDVYSAKLPMLIKSFTMSSTSTDPEMANNFLKSGMCCMLVLDVPYYYRRFIAMDNNALSGFVGEKEILFPDDAVFKITERRFEVTDGEGRLMLHLIGQVTSDPSIIQEVNVCNTMHCDQDVDLSHMHAHAGGAMRTARTGLTRLTRLAGMHVSSPFTRSRTSHAGTARSANLHTSHTGVVPSRPPRRESSSNYIGTVMDLVDLKCFGKDRSSQARSRSGKTSVCAGTRCGLSREQDADLRDAFLRILMGT